MFWRNINKSKSITFYVVLISVIELISCFKNMKAIIPILIITTEKRPEDLVDVI